ncbi:MAG: thiolase family protein [Chloroflexi bacterium]|nr:thiolase family protein [Chloroflexota bacterium]
MATRDLHRVAIVGVYNTAQARRLPNESSFSVTLDAVRGALADAGLRVADVDGLNITTGTGPGAQNQREWVHLLGGRPMWMGAQSTGIPAVLEAASAIAAGYCHSVVLANGQAGAYTERASTTPWTRPSNEFVESWGLYTAAEFALIARRHMHLYGTAPEHLAEVASAVRSHGGMNPEAVYSNGPITPEDVLNSPLIADPFHLLDCAMTGEGGAGLVLTTVERARDLAVRPVYVLGGGLDHRGPSYTMAPLWDVAGDVGRFAAAQAFGACGLGPADVDVCEFYDPFSFEVIRQFEAYGFCGPGEGGPFVIDGRIRLGGEFPICMDGGTMSFSHPGTAQLLQKVIAGTRQLRGGEGPRQVEGASVAMVSNGGAGALFTDVVVLGNDQP